MYRTRRARIAKAIVETRALRLKRGIALPLSLDLDRKAAFLHDASVGSLAALLDSSCPS